MKTHTFLLLKQYPHVEENSYCLKNSRRIKTDRQTINTDTLRWIYTQLHNFPKKPKKNKRNRRANEQKNNNSKYKTWLMLLLILLIVSFVLLVTSNSKLRINRIWVHASHLLRIRNNIHVGSSDLKLDTKKHMRMNQWTKLIDNCWVWSWRNRSLLDWYRNSGHSKCCDNLSNAWFYLSNWNIFFRRLKGGKWSKQVISWLFAWFLFISFSSNGTVNLQQKIIFAQDSFFSSLTRKHCCKIKLESLKLLNLKRISREKKSRIDGMK